MTLHKRVLDVVFATVLLVLLAPVMAVIAWMLWRAQGGPVFYVAERMKSPNESFGLWKFRTMTVVDTDTGVSGGHKRTRITPLGARLRARRLDEFPQLWNILKGDMSFVGPRPPLREYVERFPDIYRNVLKSRPGVTGLATLRFHKHEARLLARCRTAQQTDLVYTRICVPRKARLDLIYKQNQSLAFDLKLAFETVFALLETDATQRPRAAKTELRTAQFAGILTRP